MIFFRGWPGLKKFFLPFLFLIFFASLALAVILPENVLLAQQQTIEKAQGVSLLIAFLGGVLSLLSPCILPFLPAFFAYSFKGKGKITVATLAFFAGFSLVFIAFGVGIATLGSALSSFRDALIPLAGVLLILLGAMNFFGLGFAVGGVKGVKPQASAKGAFAMGLLFATGWTACLGPTLAAVLTIAGLQGQQAYGGMLMLSYSLGIFLPLFLLSFFYDSFKLYQHPLFSKELFSFEIAGRQFHVFLASAVSGILLAGLGAMFLFFGGTSPLNSLDFLGTKPLFYEWQRLIAENAAQSGTVALVLAAALAVLFFFYFKKSGGQNNK